VKEEEADQVAKSCLIGAVSWEHWYSREKRSKSLVRQRIAEEDTKKKGCEGNFETQGETRCSWREKEMLVSSRKNNA